MTAPLAPRVLPNLWKSVLISGIGALVLGTLVLTFPGKTILVLAVLLGCYLLFLGVTQVAFAFGLHVDTAARVLLFVSGAASLILGVLCFRHFGTDDNLAILLLAIWVAVGFIFRGVAAAVTAINDPLLPGRGWQLFLGVMFLGAGVLTLALPMTSLWALTMTVGVCLVVVGSAEIAVAISMRSALRELTP